MKRTIALSGLVLTGCVTTGQWVNASKTIDQYNTDAYQCQQDGELYAANLGFNGNPLVAGDRFRECMLVRGYHWQAL